MITFKQFLEEYARAPLYHGTSYKNLGNILKDNALKAYRTHGGVTEKAISLTRSMRTAANWMSREVVLELDRNKIQQKYKIIPIEVEYFWAKRNAYDDEYIPKSSGLFEEYLTTDLQPILKYLICIHYNPMELTKGQIEMIINWGEKYNVPVKVVKKLK